MVKISRVSGEEITVGEPVERGGHVHPQIFPPLLDGPFTVIPVYVGTEEVMALRAEDARRLAWALLGEASRFGFRR